MAEVTVYDADRMKAIEDATVVNGEIVGGHLILTRFDESEIDAGNVVSVAVVTSGTRPGAPTTGLFIYEIDTKRTYVWDSAAWRFVGNKYICTAATRPTGTFLFEGLEIYETDTDREYIYNGAAWIYTKGGLPLYSARAWRNAALSTPAAAGILLIAMDTESWDYNNNFDTATGRYTAPLTGLYQVHGKCGFNLTNAVEELELGIYVNATLRSGGDRHNFRGQNSGDDYGFTVSDIVYLDAGDLLDLRINHLLGANTNPLNVGNQGHNFLSVCKI